MINSKINRIEPSLNQLNNYFNKIDPELIKMVKFLDNHLNKEWKIFVKRNLLNYFNVDIILFHEKYGIKFLFINDLFNDDNIVKLTHKRVKISSKKSFYNSKKLLLDGNIIDDIFLNHFSSCKKFLKDINIEKTQYRFLFNSILFLKNVSSSKNIPIESNSKVLTRDIYKQDKETLNKFIETEEIKLNLELILAKEKEADEKFFKIVRGVIDTNKNSEYYNYLPEKYDKNNITNDDIRYAMENFKKFSSEHYNIIYPILRPSFHRIESAQKIILSNKQKRYAKVNQKTHQRLAGVAGSGKSLVAVSRAGNSAAIGKKVLTVVFNKSIKNYLRDQLKRKVRNEWYDDLITIDHFHGVLKTIKSKLTGIINNKYVKDDNGNYTINNISNNTSNISDTSYDIKIRYPQEVLDMLNKYPLKEEDKYNTIVIDEGQDFDYIWYQILSKILTKNGDLLLLADNNQNIYKNELSWMSDKRYKTNFSGEWGMLNESRRAKNKSIINVSNILIDSLDDLDKDKIIYYNNQTEFRFNKPYINWIDSSFNNSIISSNQSVNSQNKKCKDCGNHLTDLEQKEKDQTLNKCKICFEIFNECKINIFKTYEIMKNKYNKNDITILIPFQDELTDLYNYFYKKDINCTATIDKKMNSKLDFLDNSVDYKNQFKLNNQKDCVKLSTIHSYKGLSAPNVIILTYPTWATDISSDNLIYTAITRTEESLVTINRNRDYKSIGKKVMNSIN